MKLFFSFSFYPKYVETAYFRTLWISEERELVHEIAGVGELREPWHSCQMSWLENHLSLINNYNTALENLDNYRGMYCCRAINKLSRNYCKYFGLQVKQIKSVDWKGCLFEKIWIVVKDIESKKHKFFVFLFHPHLFRSINI